MVACVTLLPTPCQARALCVHEIEEKQSFAGKVRQRTGMYTVPFDKGELSFDLPPDWRGTLVESRIASPIENVPGAVTEALANPVNSPPLRELARPGDKVCIVFTDITRASPDSLLIPPILAQLGAAGVHDEDITLLCGIGMHRASTPDEKVAKLGQAVVDRYRVVDNEPQNPEALAGLGTTESGIPLSVNRVAYEADLLIATGIVEPHQYAGYSGGRKTLAVGAAGEAMIAYTHGPHMVDHPGTRLGRVEGNPFHEAITEAARRAGLRFIVNVVQDDQKRVVFVRAGEPEAAFKELVAFAKTLYEVPVPRQYDVAIAGVGFPKDANLYQASRAASYLFFAPSPVVKPGGFLIVPAPCAEGAGDGVGEQRFLKAMQDAPDVQFILEDARQHGYPPGQQRAFVMAKVLEQNPVMIVGAQDLALIQSAKFMAAPTMEAAFATVGQALGNDLEALVVPHALLTLPIVQEK
jgi:nickel-dependent lactate racemase